MVSRRLIGICMLSGLLVQAVVNTSVAAPTIPTTVALPATWPPTPPTSLILTVRETAGVARTSEVVRSGVPLPRSLNVLVTNTLTLVDASNTPIPAEFEPLARWDAGRFDTSAPIQWLLITFPAIVAANGAATYRLVMDGSAGANPSPATAVNLLQSGNQITVTTGAATFVLGGASGALFDEIRSASGVLLSKGGVITAVISQTTTALSTTRRVWVEHSGPLAAVVVIESAYDLPDSGSGAVSASRRYVFTAGSPTALVRQTLNWEGDLCPSNGWDLTCDVTGSGTPDVNGLRVTRARDALTLAVAAPFTVTALGNFASAAVQGTATVGQEARVRQQLPLSRTAPSAFEVSVPGASNVAGTKADGGLLAVGNVSSTLAVALNHMHRYAPQALRLLAGGRIAIDLVDDQIWLGQRQGTFVNFAVSALPANPMRATLNRQVWAPLNRPLRAWPTAAWFAASDAVIELPPSTLPAELTAFDVTVVSVLSRTLQKIEEKGVPGLMTFGLYPRYWDYFLHSDELDCGDDPTPSETWDNTYWCSTWTDYHNTLAAVPMWAMRSGQVEWLDELAFPGALRMLHTQIMQCAPDDTTYFYCGQAPAGYGGYRSDFNSSHAYFDNLFLYYWLTGDYTVVETLKQGASSMRAYLCPARPCAADDPPADDWAQLTGRVASQWYAAFRFVGLASDDATYLDDYKSGLARAVTQYYVEVGQNGDRYGFWLDCPVDRNARCPGVRTGPESTSQLWMVSLYDMNNLYRLQHDTNDAPLGNPALPPSQVIAAWARTLTTFGATVSGDGTASGAWPNALYFTWSGDRIGGAVITVTANTAGDDPYLYTMGKSTLTATVLRAADQTGAANLRQMGANLTLFALNAAQNDLSSLGKLQGEYWARLPAAVAHLSQPVPTPVAVIYLPHIQR